MKLLLGALNCGLLFQTSKESKAEMRIFALPVAVYFLNLTAVYASIRPDGAGHKLGRAAMCSSSSASQTGPSH